MSYKVIQWTTGQVGAHAVRGILGHPDLELVGVYASSPAKEGVDVGELVGIEPTGVLATHDLDAILASDADCVCFTAKSMDRVDDVFDDIERLLRAGKNVVNTAWAALVYPQAMGGNVYDRLHTAGLEGGASLYTTGIEPGFGSLGLATGMLSLCHGVKSVRMYEIMNPSTWVHPEGWNLSLFGFGTPDAKDSWIMKPGFTTELWGPTVALVADAIGVKLDEITQRQELAYAPFDFDIAGGFTIAEGTVCGVRFQILGMVDGEEVVAIDHLTRLRDDAFPEVTFPGQGYRVEIEGEPNLRADMAMDSPNGDHIHAAYVATAMPAVNAIPAVVEAAPGVVSWLDLKPHGTRNVLR